MLILAGVQALLNMTANFYCLLMLFLLVETQNEVHDLKHNASANAGSPHHKMYGDSLRAEGLQEPFTPVQSYHGAPLTGQCAL